MISNSDWHTACRRVIRFAIAFAVLAVASAALLQIVGGRPGTLMAGYIVIFGFVLSLAGLGVTLGVIITVVFWGVQAAKLAREHGSPPLGPLGYWAAGAFLILFAASYLATPWPPVFGTIRVLGAAALIAAVRYDRNWYSAKIGPERKYSLTDGGDPAAPLTAQPTADDWNAGLWDPDVQRDIDRRRNRPT